MLSEQKKMQLIPEGYSGEEEDPGLVMSIILHTSVIAFPFLFVATIAYSLINMYHQNTLWFLLLSLPIAWVASDFLTGIVHWLCDTYGTVNTPLFGQTLIRNFRSHHTYPKDLCISPFVFTVGHVALVGLFTLPLAISVLIKYPSSLIASSIGFTYGMIILLTALTNQFHKWAHLEPEKVSNTIKFLQKHKVILNPEHHNIHHTRPFSNNYCITHGLNNPFLEKIHFFRKIENMLAKLGINKST